MNRGTIDSFSGDHRFLSSFWRVEVELPPRWRLPGETEFLYPSTEHGYHTVKTLDLDDRTWIRRAGTPGEAKRRGQQIVLRSDWDSIKLDVMWDLLVEKFSRAELLAQLLATGDAELIEGNHWGDTFWGVCRGVGTNHLGKLLMDIRTLSRMPS